MQVLSVLSLLEQWSELFTKVMDHANWASKMPSLTHEPTKEPEPAVVDSESVSKFLSQLSETELLNLLAKKDCAGPALQALLTGKQQAAALVKLGLDQALCGTKWRTKADSLSQENKKLNDRVQELSSEIKSKEEEVASLRLAAAQGGKDTAELVEAKARQVSLEAQLSEMREETEKQLQESMAAITTATEHGQKQQALIDQLTGEVQTLKAESENGNASNAQELEAAKKRINELAAHKITMEAHAKGMLPQ